jgi:type IV fimbrial biogenesis protein FimT
MLRYKLGFTLIELLVVITLIGISVTLAVPSWEQVSQKRRLTNAAEQVASLLAVAQSEAQKRNQAVSLSFSRSGDQDWCVGANTGSSGCDCTETDSTSAQYCAIDNAPYRIESATFESLNLIEATDTQPDEGDSYITFDPVRGILQPAGDRLQFTFESSGGAFQLRLVISPTGLLTICNSGDNNTVGGYATCLV